MPLCALFSKVWLCLSAQAFRQLPKKEPSSKEEREEEEEEYMDTRARRNQIAERSAIPEMEPMTIPATAPPPSPPSTLVLEVGGAWGGVGGSGAVVFTAQWRLKAVPPILLQVSVISVCHGLLPGSLVVSCVHAPFTAQ